MYNNNSFNPCKVCSDFTTYQLVYHLNDTCKQTVEKHIQCPNCGVILEISQKIDIEQNKAMMVN